MPKACASPTNSSATSSSTPSATCTSSAGRCSAAFTAHKSGHALNNRLLRAALADPAALETVIFERAEEAPAGVARLAAQLA